MALEGAGRNSRSAWHVSCGLVSGFEYVILNRVKFALDAPDDPVADWGGHCPFKGGNLDALLAVAAGRLFLVVGAVAPGGQFTAVAGGELAGLDDNGALSVERHQT